MPKIDSQGRYTDINDPEAQPERSARTVGYELDDDALAQVAYGAYGQERDWWTYEGQRMPAWKDQDPDLRTAWRRAAAAVRGAIVEPGAVRVIPGPPSDDDEQPENEPHAEDDEAPDPFIDYPHDGTADDVRTWVWREGTDQTVVKLRATRALNEEKARATPRVTLISDLEKIVRSS